MHVFFLILSLIFYLSALFFPAFGCNYFGADGIHYTVLHGWELLLFGWYGVVVHQYSWFANIFFLVSIILLCRNSAKSFYFGIMALCIALSSLSLYLDAGNKRIGIYPGFYLWMMGFAFLCLSLKVKFSKRQSSHLPAHTTKKLAEPYNQPEIIRE